MSIIEEINLAPYKKLSQELEDDYKHLKSQAQENNLEELLDRDSNFSYFQTQLFIVNKLINDIADNSKKIEELKTKSFTSDFDVRSDIKQFLDNKRIIQDKINIDLENLEVSVFKLRQSLENAQDTYKKYINFEDTDVDHLNNQVKHIEEDYKNKLSLMLKYTEGEWLEKLGPGTHYQQVMIKAVDIYEKYINKSFEEAIKMFNNKISLFNVGGNQYHSIEKIKMDLKELFEIINSNYKTFIEDYNYFMQLGNEVANDLNGSQISTW